MRAGAGTAQDSRLFRNKSNVVESRRGEQGVGERRSSALSSRGDIASTAFYQDRLGGRIRSQSSDSTFLDIGCQWVALLRVAR